jgi:hypothetical protein
MTKAQAMTRRANKLVGWLRREDFAEYENEDSIERMARLIKLIIYALEESLPASEWKRFLKRFKECREQILDVFETAGDARINYSRTVEALILILEDYRNYVVATL